MDDYSFEISDENGCLVASFAGQITTNNYTEFRNAYNEICRRLSETDRKRLIVDLTQTTFFGSLFVGIMVKLSTAIRIDGGHIALCGLSDQLVDLMKKLLLLERDASQDGGLKHFETRADALEALS